MTTEYLTNTATVDALAMLEEISDRARAMNISLVAYPVDDVEAVCAALRAVRETRPEIVRGPLP